MTVWFLSELRHRLKDAIGRTRRRKPDLISPAVESQLRAGEETRSAYERAAMAGIIGIV
jgi:hypothetical protein